MNKDPLIVGSDSENCKGEYRTVALQAKDISGSLSFMKQNGIKNLTINSEKGWSNSKKNLNFLKSETWIEGVDIMDNDIDVESVNTLPNLKRLLLPDRFFGVIDLLNFENLESLAATYNEKHLLNFEMCTKLKYLRIDHLSKENLLSLSNNKQLEELHLLYSPIKHLSGIEKLNSLKTIYFHNLPKLENINEISHLHQNLKTLFIDGCKNIKTYTALEKLIGLRRFQILNSASINSVTFLSKFRNLEICFIGVEVLDKNVEILKSHNIKYKKYPSYDQ